MQKWDHSQYDSCWFKTSSLHRFCRTNKPRARWKVRRLSPPACVTIARAEREWRGFEGPLQPTQQPNQYSNHLQTFPFSNHLHSPIISNQLETQSTPNLQHTDTSQGPRDRWWDENIHGDVSKVIFLKSYIIYLFNSFVSNSTPSLLLPPA